jgi:hypothetical protein
MTAGILAFVGAALTLVASALPWTRLNFGSGHFQSEAIFNLGSGAPGVQYWYAVEPAGVALIGILCGVLLLAAARRGRLGVVAAGMLIAMGFQTLFLFAGYALGYLYGGNQIGPGGPLGMVAGVLLATAGFFGLSGLARQASQDPAPGAGGPASGPGMAAPYPPQYPAP